MVVRATVREEVPCGTDVICEGKNPKKNPEYFKPSMENLRRCYCDKECVEYGDCCKDKAPFPYSRNENITWSCVLKSYNQTVYAVSECIYKGGWNDMCRKHFYIPQLEYLSDLPVFSNYTGLYYANVFCAFCDPRLWMKYGSELANYVSRPNLITQCSPKIDLHMLKVEGRYLRGRLLWTVRNGYCAIFQQEEEERGRTCMPSVSTCPTGAESALSDKCQAYSQLLSFNDTIFRNPHCAICNGVNISDSCKYRKPIFELQGLDKIFSLNWFLDSCVRNMQLRDNLHEECKSLDCEFVTGKCRVNQCDDTCDFKSDHLVKSGYVIYACLSASIVCLLIHVYRAIFFCPPKNLPSRIINSLAWSMLVAQTLFLTSIYSLAKIPNHASLCYIAAVTVQYFFLASFLWMNVISFDLWFTFSNTFQLFSTSYKKYAFYAWGCTGVILTISVIVDLTDFFPDCMRPKFGPLDNVCWLGSYHGLVFYFALPICIILVLNTIFFILTIRLFRQQQSSVLAISGRKEYSLLLFYIKVSTAIGMTWVVSLIIMAFNSKPEVHIALSVLNGLQGVFIYITFDLKTDSIFSYVKRSLLRFFDSKECESKI